MIGSRARTVTVPRHADDRLDHRTLDEHHRRGIVAHAQRRHEVRAVWQGETSVAVVALVRDGGADDEQRVVDAARQLTHRQREVVEGGARRQAG